LYALWIIAPCSHAHGELVVNGWSPSKRIILLQTAEWWCRWSWMMWVTSKVKGERQRSKAADNPLALMEFQLCRTGMFYCRGENLLLLHSAWLFQQRKIIFFITRLLLFTWHSCCSVKEVLPILFTSL